VCFLLATKCKPLSWAVVALVLALVKTRLAVLVVVRVELL
jgi:hypothetical protein